MNRKCETFFGKKYRMLLVTGILVLTFLFIVEFEYLPDLNILKFKQKISTNSTKIILFTTSWWWESEFPYLKEANAICSKCIFTQDEAFWDQSEAVIFHGRFLNEKVPKRYDENQIWVMMVFETVSLNLVGEHETYIRMKLYDGLFNWTMTYRKDSDVFVPYGRFIPIKQTPRPNSSETWAFITGAKKERTYDDFTYMVTPSIENFKERKLGAWITSRCNSPSLRERKISELSQHLPIDIYGNCGTMKCEVPKDEALTGIDCRMQIHKNYKFYFAFENSICDDYVTEKFFDIGLTEMIPVVFGGADYKSMFPPKSFINIMDFNTTADLATYLKFVSENSTEWLKYFEWRKDFWVQTNRFVSGYCDLCDKLWNTTEQIPKTYSSIADWWVFGKSYYTKFLKPACSVPNPYFKKSLF